MLDCVVALQLLIRYLASSDTDLTPFSSNRQVDLAATLVEMQMGVEEEEVRCSQPA